MSLFVITTTDESYETFIAESAEDAISQASQMRYPIPPERIKAVELLSSLSNYSQVFDMLTIEISEAFGQLKAYVKLIPETEPLLGNLLEIGNYVDGLNEWVRRINKLRYALDTIPDLYVSERDVDAG